MELFEAIFKRRSVRAYKDEPIKKEEIEKLIESASWAATGANLQPWKFIIITDPEIKEKVGEKARFYFIKSHHASEAPCLIAVLADLKKSKWAVIDASMASQNLMLAATALGLGTCFIGAFDEEEVKRTLEIPEHYKVVGLITVGKPAENPSRPPRLPVKEITYFDKFGKESYVQRALQYRKSGPLTVIKKVIKLILRL
jgi:nitroreductase